MLYPSLYTLIFYPTVKWPGAAVKNKTLRGYGNKTPLFRIPTQPSKNGMKNSFNDGNGSSILSLPILNVTLVPNNIRWRGIN